MARLTPWFPGHVRPARKGVYQRRGFGAVNGYAMWDGHAWLLSDACPKEAAQSLFTSLYQHNNDHKQDFMWRGLAKEPK